MPAKAEVHLDITLTTSSPTYSLSRSDSSTPFQLITTARIVSSSEQSFAVTLCTDNSVLDNGQHTRHNGLFKGAFYPLQSLSDAQRKIRLAFAGSPNYGSGPDDPNLRERPWQHFDTIPAQGQGELTINDDLALERMFKHEHKLKPADIKPGEKFRVLMTSRRLNSISWWAFGDLAGDLKDKKFSRWWLPDENGEIENLMQGEEYPDTDQMQKDGWVFSERPEGLTVTGNLEDGAVFEFVK